MNPGYEIDFLAVGNERSGDAIALRFGNLYGRRNEQTVVIVDGGFAGTGESVVNHVRSHYGTNQIDLVVSTHPDADHAGGLETVLSVCDVRSLWMHQPWNHTDDIAKMFKDGRVTDSSISEALRKSLDEAKTLEKIAIARKIPIVEPFAGTLDASGCVCVLGPSRSYYDSLLPSFRPCPEPVMQPAGFFAQTFAKAEEALKRVAENFNFETLDDDGETSAENNSSTILLFVVGERFLLLTADAGMPALSQALDLFDRAGLDRSKITFVQVPHHGSRRNVGPTLLNRLLGPKLQQETTLRTAFVSVAKVDDAKHPSKKAINAFRRRGAPVLATGGQAKNHYWNAPGWPARAGWVSVDPLTLYTSFEE